MIRMMRRAARDASGGNLRHILIVGASGGLGEALARVFAAPGRHLSLWGRDGRRLAAAAAICRGRGAVTGELLQDIRDLEQSRRLLAALDVDWPLDLAVLAAGVSSGTLPDGSPERIEDACRTLEVNAVATVNLAATLLTLMAARGRGRVAVVASLAALYPLPDSPAYCASKAALACYVRAVRPLFPEVRVSLVCPGYVDTSMSRRVRGPQPMRWSAEKAAARIAESLEAGEEDIVFPLLPALGLRVLSLLPAGPARFFARRFAFTVRPDAGSAQLGGGTVNGGARG
jgi:short-subunit dehydrogenase